MHLGRRAKAAVTSALMSLAALPVLAAAQDGAPIQPPSLSIGTCHDGELQGAIELPTSGPGYRRLSVVGQRGTGFATRRTVEFVTRAAARLQQLDGHQRVTLRVGNLSLAGGGPLRWSHSHRSGRDVDLVFYAVDLSGKSRSPDRFLHYDDLGQARWRRHRYRFDIARNWNLVRTLLTDDQTHIARLYIAEPLRRSLLDHGRELGEPEWLLQRAGHVLHEPTHAGHHDDHLHVRVYCSRDEVLSGCVDEDPPWPWVPDFRRARRRRIEDAVTALGSPDVETRAASLAALAPLHRTDREATDALVWTAAYDTSPTLRRRALHAVAGGQSPWAFPTLVAAAQRTGARWRAFKLLSAATQTASPNDAAGLLGLLDCDREPYRDLLSVEHVSVLRRQVARKVRGWMLEESVRPLLRVLDDEDQTTRRAALRTLEHLANRRFATPTHARRWYGSAVAYGRLHWMYDGFFRAGVPVEAPPHMLAPRLIDLLRGPDEVLASNAEALLSRVTGGVTLRYVQTPPRRHRAWRRWWQLHHERFEWQAQRPAPKSRVERRVSAIEPST